MKPTIIITRPPSKQHPAKTHYQQAGFHCLALPCFQAHPNLQLTSTQLRPAEKAQVLIILNSHALTFLEQKQLDFNPKQIPHIIAIGPAAAQKWQQLYQQKITVNDGGSEQIIQQLKLIQPKQIAIFTALGGRKLIKQYATKHAISYSQINSYHRQPLKLPETQLANSLQTNNCLLTATSGQIITRLQQLNSKTGQKLRQIPIICGSSRIAQIAHQNQFQQIHTARSPSNQHMLQTIQKITEQRTSEKPYSE